MADRDLVERARRGDREAFAVLVHQVSDSLYAVAYPDPARHGPRRGRAAERPRHSPGAGSRSSGTRTASRPGSTAILVHACYDESQRTRHWTAERPGPADATGRRTPGRQRRRSPTATSSSGRSDGSRSSSGRCSSCTTTSGCRWSRSPRLLGIPAGTARSATPLRHRRAPRRPSTADRGAHRPGRTPGMTDDRSLRTRRARSWLEVGPIEAPERRGPGRPPRSIDTTPQERDLRVPWRFPAMTHDSRARWRPRGARRPRRGGALFLSRIERRPRSPGRRPAPSASLPAPSASSSPAGALDVAR